MRQTSCKAKAGVAGMMQKMKKSGERSSFHNASSGNMQMASQEDFAWDENIAGKASQRPLILQWWGLIERTPREGDREAGHHHELEVKRPGRTNVLLLYLQKCSRTCVETFFLRGSKPCYLTTLYYAEALDPNRNGVTCLLKSTAMLPLAFGMEPHAWGAHISRGKRSGDHEALLFSWTSRTPLYSGRGGAGRGGGPGSGGRTQWSLQKLYLNSVHTQETAMGENCEKKTFILQARRKITILYFLIDLFEMHLEVLGCFCFSTMGVLAGRLVVTVQNSSWNLNMGTRFQPQWQRKNKEINKNQTYSLEFKAMQSRGREVRIQLQKT